jgi:hypothetical protein
MSAATSGTFLYRGKIPHIATLMRATGLLSGYAFAFSRRTAPEFCKYIGLKKQEGAGNAGCAVHPQSRVQSSKHTGVVTTGSPGHPAFPARWLYGLLRALPGDRLDCHHHRCDAKHHHQLDASIGASGPHDFAVRVSTVRQRHIGVHRSPHPTSVTIAIRPSEGARDGCYTQMICVRRKAKTFCARGWTGFW